MNVEKPVLEPTWFHRGVCHVMIWELANGEEKWPQLRQHSFVFVVYCPFGITSSQVSSEIKIDKKFLKTWIIDAYHLARAYSGSPSQYVPSSSPYTYQSSSSSWKCQRLTEGSRAARGGRPLTTSAGSQAPLQVPPWTPSIKWWTGVDVSVTVCQ